MEGSAEVWVGQGVALNLEVIVPTWFTSAPVFPQLEVKNAVTLSPEGAVNFVVQSSGKSFAAQAQRCLIYPQAKGKYTVPSMKVGVAYVLPDGKPSSPNLLATPPVQFEARMPPGAEAARYFLTTDDLQITQSFSRKPDKLQIGDSITRMITMTAQNTVGISLPPLKFEAPVGVRLYPGEPRVTEAAERGKIEATRTETATYVSEKEGRYSLPEITILWWNPRTKAMTSSTLPPVALKVEASATYNPEVFASSQAGEEPSGKPEASLWKRLSVGFRWTLSLLAACLLLLVLRRALGLKGLSLGAYLDERRNRKAEAEPTYFTQFRKACLSNDPKASLQHLMRWLDRANTRASAATLRQFVSESRMPELANAARELADVLFAAQTKTEPAKSWRKRSGERLYRLVATARSLEKARSNRQHRRMPLVHNLDPAEQS